MAESKKSFFNNRFVQVIMVSGTLLQLGIWIRNFAILLFVMEQTDNNPIYVSLISIAEFAPIFIFSFIGGTFADRWRPKLTMIWSDFLSAVSVFVVLLAIIYGSWQAVFFVTLISAILSQFSQPSAMKLFKVHVPPEQLQMGMALYQTLMAIFMIIGPGLGTYIYHLFGITVSVGIMGACFLLSALVLFLLPKDKVDKNTEEPKFWKELKDGFQYVFKRKTLRLLGFNFAFAGLAVGLIQPLMVFVVIEQLGLPKEHVSWLLMTNGAAMLIGGGIVMAISKKIAPERLLFIGMLVCGLAIMGVGFSTNLYLTLLLYFIDGLFFPCIHVGINTLILQTTEEKFVGRVNGVLNPMFMGMMVVTMSIAGFLKSIFSIPTIYSFAALFFLLGLLCVIPLLKKDTNLVKSSS